jgi:hypothetical protein
MQLTPNLNLKKPEGTDVVDIADLNENADKLDAEVAKLASTAAPGRMSVTDKTKLDSATSDRTASTLVQRDGSGRFKAAAPAAADDVARKQEITDHTDIKATTGGVYGHTTLVDATNSTVTDKAATARAVKEAFDQASRVAVTPLPDGSDFNDVIQPGFYRLGANHVNAPSANVWYGQMLVIRGGSDTIVQMCFGHPNSSFIYSRSGNPRIIGGGSDGIWHSWVSVVTSAGGTVTGSLSINGGVFLPNNVAVVGTYTDNAQRGLLYVTPGNSVIVGHTASYTGIHSAAAPSWWDGSVSRDLIHDGGGQIIHGGLTVNGDVNGKSIAPGYTAGTIANTAGFVSNLKINSTGVSNDPFMSFHIPGEWAGHFGVRAADKRLAIGGYTLGNNSFRVWDERDLYVGTSPPTGPVVGAIWIDTN